jgi:hypothetical protein|tara:strand:+ start:4594 stop:4869 length:276 start_codon:yes stop_codon:yes gene_type:complete
MAIVNHISNYYELVVSEEIRAQLASRVKPPAMDFMADVACVALNRLPPKYFRYEVDMAFYMSPNELFEVKQRVSQVVTEAIAFVEKHSRLD